MIYTYKTMGETPAKKNSRITLKNGKTIPSKAYMLWHESASIELLPQLKPTAPIDKPCLIVLHFFHGDYRRRDSDNGTSSILDLLQDCGILKDDNWQIVKQIAIANFYDKENPRCEITIQEL